MAENNIPFQGIEGTVFINLNQDADETVTDGWVRKAYVSGLTMDHNKNQTDVYDKYDKVGSKKGRNEIKGSIKQGFCTYASNLQKMFIDNTSFAIKVEMQINGEGPVVSTFYLSRCDFSDVSFDFGDTNNGGSELTFSGNFSVRAYHWVDAA
jgi:ribosomal protein S17E